jgi:hypothetical protein
MLLNCIAKGLMPDLRTHRSGGAGLSRDHIAFRRPVMLAVMRLNLFRVHME